jgi:phosphopantetheine adenylyltransferase
MTNNEQRQQLLRSLKQTRDEWRTLSVKCLLLKVARNDTLKELVRLEKALQDLDTGLEIG